MKQKMLGSHFQNRPGVTWKLQMSVPGVTKSAKTWSHVSINHLLHLYTVAREIVIYNKTSLIQAPKMTVSHVDVLFTKLSVS